MPGGIVFDSDLKPTSPLACYLAAALKILTASSPQSYDSKSSIQIIQSQLN